MNEAGTGGRRSCCNKPAYVDGVPSAHENTCVVGNPLGHQWTEGGSCAWCGETNKETSEPCPAAQKTIFPNWPPIWCRKPKYLPPDNKG